MDQIEAISNALSSIGVWMMDNCFIFHKMYYPPSVASSKSILQCQIWQVYEEYYYPYYTVLHWSLRTIINRNFC